MPSFTRLLNLVLHPVQLRDRLIERRMSSKAQHYYQTTNAEAIQASRRSFFQQNIDTIVAEAEASEIYKHLLQMGQNSLVASQTTGMVDCVTMYVLVRFFKPRLMVETGVFYGAMSAMILEAMRQNGEGTLYSIDLPIESDGLGDLRGVAVPDTLRSNWHLILGDSRTELPKLLNQLGKVDIFNHDSLHTTAHMLWEYQTAWGFIKRGGLLTSHDILMTPAWTRFTTQHQHEIAQLGHIYGLGLALKSP